MFSKTFSLLSVLLVVAVTIMPLSKVQAQGLVEYAIILVVAGFNKNEKSEFYWRTNPASSEAAIQYGDFADRSVIYLDVTESNNSNCTQSILIPMVNKERGVTIISHIEYTDSKQLVLNGFGGDDAIKVDLKQCFEGRIVARLGVPIPREQKDRISRELTTNPNVPVAGMPRIEGFAISDAVTGETRSSVTGSGQWTTLDDLNAPQPYP
jgi:hypothetical protein